MLHVTREPDSGVQIHVALYASHSYPYSRKIQNRLLLAIVSEPLLQCNCTACLSKFENKEMQGFQYRLAPTTDKTCWLHVFSPKLRLDIKC